MSQNPCLTLPADSRQESFVISWWEARGSGDESTPCWAVFGTQEAAEEALRWLECDPANDLIRCSWSDHHEESIPF
jgi:hypothetical protein